MSGAPPPRLRLLRTTLFYLLAWSPIAAVASIIGTFFAGSPLRAGEFLTNPREMFGFLLLVYVFGAVPSILNGMIVAITSPGSTRPWMLPLASGLWGLALFGVTGIWAVKSFGLFAVVGGVAGAVCGLIVLIRRGWFSQPRAQPAAPSSGSATGS